MKRHFFLFRRKREDGVVGYFYIQHVTSPSHDEGLTNSAIPELSWRGKTLLDIEKMKYMISIDRFYNKYYWELVKFEMESESPSWANPPIGTEYEPLKISKFERLTKDEEWELERFKEETLKTYKRK